MVELIEALAKHQAMADAKRTGGTLLEVPATTTEILDTIRDPVTGHTAVWFVFDFLVLHGTQSGSDWYDHHVFAGSATLTDDAVIDATLVRLREAYVTEFSMEWASAGERYDRDRVRDADRDAWCAKHLSRWARRR